MGFDAFFKHKKYGHYDGHGYYRQLGGIQKYIYLFEKLKSNRNLLKIIVISAIVAVIVAAIIVIGLVIMLVPLFGKLIGAIQENGLSGLIETAIPWLELLWSGNGK